MICGSPWPSLDNAQGGFNDLPTRHFRSIHLREGQGAQTITLKLMSPLTLAAVDIQQGEGGGWCQPLIAVLSTSCFRKMDLGWLFTPASKMLFQRGVKGLAIGQCIRLQNHSPEFLCS